MKQGKMIIHKGDMNKMLKFLSLSVRNLIYILLVYFFNLSITNKLFKHINNEISIVQSQPSIDKQLKENKHTSDTIIFGQLLHGKTLCGKPNTSIMRVYFIIPCILEYN